jgi:uncharacterized damage-inducible protein DinB
MNLDLDLFLAYTEWQREQWRAWLRQHSDAVLKTSAGPHGDGRMNTAGEIIRHIFSAEKRYIDRLSGRELTDPASISAEKTEALFAFGESSRRELRQFIAQFPASQWDVPAEHKILTSALILTPRKIIVHVVMHEIRHWAQLATLLRLSGYKVDFQDFLFSPVLGGEIWRGEQKAGSAG